MKAAGLLNSRSRDDSGTGILLNMASTQVGQVDDLIASTAETSKGVFRCKILFEEDMAGLFFGTTAEVRLASTSVDRLTSTPAGAEEGHGSSSLTSPSQRGLGFTKTTIAVPPRYIPDRAEEALSVEKLTLHIARFKYMFDCFMDWTDDYDRYMQLVCFMSRPVCVLYVLCVLCVLFVWRPDPLPFSFPTDL